MFKNPYKEYVVDEGVENSFLLEKVKTLEDELQNLRERYNF